MRFQSAECVANKLAQIAAMPGSQPADRPRPAGTVVVKSSSSASIEAAVYPPRFDLCPATRPIASPRANPCSA